MSKIPLTKDFSITANVISPAGTALDANGLMLTNNDLIPANNIRTFSSAQEVFDLFGTNTIEGQAATQYFSGYDNATVIPASLLMSRIALADASGWLLSGSLKGMKLSEIRALTGTVNLTVDGNTVTSTAVDFSAVNTLSNVAAELQTAIGSSVTVEYRAMSNRLIIRSATTGADSAVSFATDGEVATGLKLTADTGATISQGVAAQTLTEVMNSVVNVNQDWVGFMSISELSDEQQGELCAWVSAQNNRYFYVPWDKSGAATVRDNASCFVQSWVIANNYTNVFPVYGDYRYAVTALAYAASLDFARTNGRVSFKFRQFSGLAPNVSDLATAQALESNGYNYFGAYGLNKTLKNYAADGKITGDFVWLDSFIGQVWIRANLVAAFANLFTANQSYPFNDNGYTAISSAVIDVANTAKNFGAIRAGVTLDQSQITQINATTGKDISATLFSDGWYFYIPSQTGAARLERKLQGAIFYYVDGQLIQSVQMSATDIL